MKFLLCHNYYRNSGGESEVFEAEAEGLALKGNDVLVFNRQNTSIDHFNWIERADAFASAYYSLDVVGSLEQLIHAQRPDIAIVQNVFPLLSPSVYVTLSKAKIPIIQAVYNYRLVCPSAELFTEGKICERCVRGNTAHAVVHKCYQHSYLMSAWYASIIGLHRWLGTFSARIDSFMVPDDFLGKKLAEGGIPAEKVWKNPNPFFVNSYEPRHDHQGYFLFVGRLVHQKGILTLLKAISIAADKVRLKIIGRGELENEIAEQIADKNLNGRVDMLGPLWGEDVAELIRGCVAVVIPSEWYDNLPVILCQANAMGKSVIASSINGLPEYVQNGINGYLTVPGDPLSLARALNHVSELSPVDYNRLSNLCRKYAEDVLDYSNHYRNLMEKVESIKRRGV